MNSLSALRFRPTELHRRALSAGERPVVITLTDGRTASLMGELALLVAAQHPRSRVLCLSGHPHAFFDYYLAPRIDASAVRAVHRRDLALTNDSVIASHAPDPHVWRGLAYSALIVEGSASQHILPVVLGARFAAGHPVIVVQSHDDPVFSDGGYPSALADKEFVAYGYPGSAASAEWCRLLYKGGVLLKDDQIDLFSTFLD